VVTRPFPHPGRLVQAAYRDLLTAQYGTEEERAALGRIEALDRPWDPPTCKPAVRQQVWQWLDQVAAWVNQEYAWSVDRLIPPCWPAHPHIAHDVAVLADQRRTAGQALGSDRLEEWHRYSLPMFLDRLVTRLGNGCLSRHDDWPAAARHRAYLSPLNQQARTRWFVDDLTINHAHVPAAAASYAARFALVDLGTGEVTEPDRPNGGR